MQLLARCPGSQIFACKAVGQHELQSGTARVVRKLTPGCFLCAGQRILVAQELCVSAPDVHRSQESELTAVGPRKFGHLQWPACASRYESAVGNQQGLDFDSLAGQCRLPQLQGLQAFSTPMSAWSAVRVKTFSDMSMRAHTSWASDCQSFSCHIASPSQEQLVSALCCVCREQQ